MSFLNSLNQEVNYFSAIPAVEFNPGALGASFVPLNGSGFTEDIKILKIFNGGTIGVDISFDGVTKHDFWPAGATLIIDFQANHAENPNSAGGTKYGRKGQIIYGRTSSTETYLQIAGFR